MIKRMMIRIPKKKFLRNSNLNNKNLLKKSLVNFKNCSHNRNELLLKNKYL